ncbi:YraN family protein [Georgenia sp. TF02-10]|uniref:YraN family protein n=1 Tax=Georgenia sp. TF02-10 TaxID=2917725 RepID=UPI001FA7F400|nr:YraN family protein [Georgenia sp. TF02-10]UNX55898.1 YraN family protein [Georgenia sp. TF02-10]
MRAKDAVGAYGERVAVRLLADQGLEVLARNWRCAVGEIDVVALDRDRDEVVFVEVKTRRSTAYGDPAEAVTAVKLARLRRLAGQWLAAHDAHPARVRIDVVAVLARTAGPAQVRHLKAVG